MGAANRVPARGPSAARDADGWSAASGQLAKTYKIAEAVPTQYASTAQDPARGKRTEIDHLNGYVVRRGDALGIPTPANRALYALVKTIEGKRQQ